jgi:hypothetical protein
MKSLQKFCLSLVDAELVPTGLRTGLIVVSILLAINHGSAIISGQMSRDRWFSGLLNNPYVNQSDSEALRIGADRHLCDNVPVPSANNGDTTSSTNK